MFQKISKFWNRIQGYLFPMLEAELGPLTEKMQHFISILEMLQVESFINTPNGYVGRPQKNRAAFARAFVAKIFYNIPTTRALIERLVADTALRRICGWEWPSSIPDETTFSRVFNEFATTELPQYIHEVLIKELFKGEIVGHVSKDATAIEAREKPIKKEKKEQPKKKRGRPKKGEEIAPESKRLDKQLVMTQEERLKDLPTACDVGAKKNSKGNTDYWIGYKLHIDTADGDIPLSCILTSASIHDSQVAIPLAAQTASRVVSLYDLADSAYDCAQIDQFLRDLGHIPIIDKNTRKNIEAKKEREQEAKALKTINWIMPETLRYNQRSSAERVNSRLKDEFGGRTVRVRGHAKVACHLMFGILVLTADAILNLIR